jgi:tripartite-type tricarboxylate transporter receptor subunit TctC
MKKILSKILCGIALSAAVVAPAMAWPTKPLTIVVTAPAGATADQIARRFQFQLSEKLGVPVVILYKPGGDTKIGTKFVVQSNNDHTILLSTGQVNALRDPIGDHTLDNLRPVSIVAASPSLVTTAANNKIIDAKQMLTMKDLTAGTANGSTSEILIKASGQGWTYIGYAGGAPMFIDLMAGHINLGVNSAMGSYTHIVSGKLRPLMVFSKNRLSQFPGVPTSYELGIPVEGEVWFGFMAPKSLSEVNVKKLSNAIVEIAKDPKYIEKLASEGATPMALNPEESQRYVTQDLKNLTNLYKDIIK